MDSAPIVRAAAVPIQGACVDLPWLEVVALASAEHFDHALVVIASLSPRACAIQRSGAEFPGFHLHRPRIGFSPTSFAGCVSLFLYFDVLSFG